jgi:uncharacterized protein YjbI with pentapeptide repeats
VIRSSHDLKRNQSEGSGQNRIEKVPKRVDGLSDASLREADLRGTVFYPAETIGAKFYGAKFSANDDAAEYARIALEEMCRRMRINPGSVAFRKLQKMNGFSEFLAPAQAPPATRGRPHYFVESI